MPRALASCPGKESSVIRVRRRYPPRHTSSLSLGPLASASATQSSPWLLACFLDFEPPIFASAQSSSARFAFSIYDDKKSKKVEKSIQISIPPSLSQAYLHAVWKYSRYQRAPPSWQCRLEYLQNILMNDVNTLRFSVPQGYPIPCLHACFITNGHLLLFIDLTRIDEFFHWTRAKKPINCDITRLTKPKGPNKRIVGECLMNGVYFTHLSMACRSCAGSIINTINIKSYCQRETLLQLGSIEYMSLHLYWKEIKPHQK